MADTAIYLVPIDGVDPNVTEALRAAVADVFGHASQVLAPVPPRSDAHDSARGQFLSDLLLDQLRAGRWPGAHRVLGVVDADCYTPGLNFVFGQASRPGREALIALARLREEFYGQPPDPGLFTERAVKEAVHELGHTYGLGHCPDRSCVMYFSNRLADTDHKSARFCRRCLAALPGPRGGAGQR